jgi:hypothetical protein
MSGRWVACVYRPKKGKEAELLALFGRHYDTLKEEGLVTNRPHLLLRSPTDGSFIELFEWKSESASSDAHENRHVMEIWDAFGKCAEMLKLADLPEASDNFPHFEDATQLAHSTTG